METKFKVVSLFPTPLFITTLPFSLSKVVSWLNNQPMKKSIGENWGVVSQDTYILENKECLDLKSAILKNVLLFNKEFLTYKTDSFKFTQSWITHKLPGQSHEIHNHSNSLISGIFYFDTQKESPSNNIIFHQQKPYDSYFNLPLIQESQPNPFNSNSSYFSPSPGNLFLFPSYLKHSVPKNTTNKVRKSLAFNIVPTEGLGSEDSLNQLKFN